MGLLRTIGGRVRSFRFIKSASDHHGERIGGILNRKVNPLLPEGLKVDFLALIHALVALLRWSCDGMVGAERRLVTERGNDPRRRRERDEDASTLSSVIQLFRDAFRTNYLPEDVEEYGFPRELSQVPFELLRQGEHLVEVFSQPDLEIPEPKVGDGLPIDELVGRVKDATDKLRESLDAADRETRLAEVALVEKNRAVDDWDGVMPWASRTLSGLFHLAGEHELAGRILPSPTRRGRIVQVDEEEAEASEPGDGSDAPADEVPAGDDSGDPADSPAPSENGG